MAFCTQCGAVRQGEQRFCTKCGTPYDSPAEPDTTLQSSAEPTLPSSPAPGMPYDSPAEADTTPHSSAEPTLPSSPVPDEPLQAPPRASRRRLAAMLSAAVVLVAAVVVGLLVAFRHTGSTSTGGAQPPLTTLAIPTSQTPSETNTDETTPDTTSNDTTPRIVTTAPRTPTPYSGNSVVSVAPAAASDPRAPTVVTLLTRYFTDINQRNFGDYFALYAPDVRAALDQAQIVAGYGSTEVSGGRLTDISTAADGRPVATVTFTSTQDAADGPDGQTCTHWTVGFFLENAGRAYLFGSPPSNYQTEHVAC
jgi:hypothetical protein